MIPAKTTPLAKSIRTLEGILVTASSVALGVAGLPAVHAINPTVAAVCIGVQNVALLVQRGSLKAIALKAVGDVVTSPDPLQAILSDVESAIGPTTAPTPPVA